MGAPLRRVNQAYVIATSTTVDVSKISVDKFGDEYFGKPKTSKKKKGEFFEAEEEKSELSAERKADQGAVDGALVKTIQKTPLMAKYLKARFSLSKGQAPHAMKF